MEIVYVAIKFMAYILITGGLCSSRAVVSRMVAINLLEFRWEQNQISVEFEFIGKYFSESETGQGSYIATVEIVISMVMIYWSIFDSSLSVVGIDHRLLSF